VGGVDHWLLLLAAAWHAGGVQIEHYKYNTSIYHILRVTLKVDKTI
jgi:hypothetical protein